MRTELRTELVKMRFKDNYGKWKQGSITQKEAGELLGVSERTFRRYCAKYEDDGLESLTDRRLLSNKHNCAPVDEVLRLTSHYKSKYIGWNVKHYHQQYQETGGTRSYSWVKNKLQQGGLVGRSKLKTRHRKKRDRKPMVGMMIHQDGSTHEWLKDQTHDLIITLDDATNEHYSMFLCDQEGTMSSLLGVMEVIDKKGLFSQFYSDRGSHYWLTREVGGKVDKHNLTQFGRVLKELQISMIAAYSPEARGRCERMFRTHQDRLPKELLLHGITTIEEANLFIRSHYLPRFNSEFMVSPSVEGSSFIPWTGVDLREKLCIREARTVRNDNCVSYKNLVLQLPPSSVRHHFVKVEVVVHEYISGGYGIYFGPRKLAEYTDTGALIEKVKKLAA